MSGPDGKTEGKIEALEGELATGRLHHAILLQGKNLKGLEEGAIRLSRSILDMQGNSSEHPDLFHLRPAGKARLISVETTRKLIADLNQTASQGECKVALLHEADRMRREAANAFLKTLEEPPLGTFLILITTRPYSLLSTIRSRCLHVRLDEASREIEGGGWGKWLEAYGEWIELATDLDAIRSDRAAPIFAANGLILRFRAILAQRADEAWAKRKTTLPKGLDEKEMDAMEAGIRRGVRTTLLSALEEKTRDLIVTLAAKRGEVMPGRKLARVIEALEKTAGFLEVNLKEETALEYFWLTSLRAWTSK